MCRFKALLSCRNIQLSLFGKCKELWKITAAVRLETPHSNQSSVSYWKWTSLPQWLGVRSQLITNWINLDVLLLCAVHSYNCPEILISWLSFVQCFDYLVSWLEGHHACTKLAPAVPKYPRLGGTTLPGASPAKKTTETKTEIVQVIIILSSILHLLIANPHSRGTWKPFKSFKKFLQSKWHSHCSDHWMWNQH